MRHVSGIAAFLSCLLLVSAGPVSAASFTLTGTVRDFKRGDVAGGHPDFETKAGTDPGIVQTALGADGKPVYAGLAGNPTTTGLTEFNQWYHDAAGVNLSTPFTVTFNDDGINGDQVAGNGIYTYANTNFFPIDGQLWGNEGLSHNYHFTYELHTTFQFVTNQTFTFLGDDDLWVFINNSLAVDLGGVHGALQGSVALNTLGLTAGNTYNLDLFFAERHTSASNFVVTTNIPLQTSEPPLSTVPEPASLVLLGSGLVGLVARAKRRLR